MHLPVILRVTGILLALFSLALLVPVIVAMIYGEDTIETFVTAFAITALSGLALWIPNRGGQDLRAGDGFMITALFYVGLGLFGALPIYLAESTALSFTDAAFESLSGLTTTGATVISGLDGLPKSILFYRQLLQWYGGMGIIVLAIAILPMLGIGGMQLYRGGVARARQGHQAHATDRGDRQGALVPVPWAYRSPARCRTGWPEWTCSTPSATAFPPWPSAASPPTMPASAISTVPRSKASPSSSW